MNRIFGLVGQKQRSVGSAAFVLVVMVFLSRVLGLARDRLLASYFVPDELGVYFAAFRLPNLLFELLVMGALTTAFIPVFTRYISDNNEQEGHTVASILINVSLVVLCVVSVPIMIFAKEISLLLAPGFSESEIALMASFTRLMILFQVFPLMIGNVFTGILQSYKYFVVPAAAPIVYNIGIIVGIVVLSPTIGLYAPVFGIAIGALLFMVIQLPLLYRVGFRHKALFSYTHKGVKEVGTLMLPRMFGLAASQIDSTVDLMLATLLGARMVTIFNFAQHLQYLPVGLFGITIAQAALPSLSQATVKKDIESFQKTVISATHQVLFFILPASSLFIILRIPIVRLVFGADQFDWESTVLTSKSLSMFSLSLFAQALIHVFARGFYALYDSRTPVIVSIVSIVINSILSVLFIMYYRLPVWALGLSTSIASIVHIVLLFVLLDKKVGGFPRKTLLFSPIMMGMATIIMTVMLYVPLKLFDQLVFDTTRTFGLLLLTGLTGCIGMGSYFFFSWVLGVDEIHSFVSLLKRVRKRMIFLEPASQVINGGSPDSGS